MARNPARGVGAGNRGKSHRRFWGTDGLRVSQVSPHWRRQVTVGVPDITARVANRLRLLARDDAGLAITEYGMLVAFAALALIALATVFGSQISSWFAAKTGAVTTV